MLKNVPAIEVKRMERAVLAKLAEYEKAYGLRVLAWAERGSLASGIFRNNSDLDVVFIFACNDGGKLAIHDIAGHGIDMIGWNVSLTLPTLLLPAQSGAVFMEQLVECSFSLGQEYARMSLDYYNGIYCIYGNSGLCGVEEGFARDGWPAVLTLYQPDASVGCLLKTAKSLLLQLKANGVASACAYLNALWCILKCQDIRQGELPGYKRIDSLLEICEDEIVKREARLLISAYRNMTTKNDGVAARPVLNEYIKSQYNAILRQSGTVHLEIDEAAVSAMERLWNHK